MAYQIYVINNLVLYFLLIKFLDLRYKKRKKSSFIFILSLFSVMVTSLLNEYNVPIINLSSHILFYYIIGYLCFIHTTKKDYFYDFIYFILFVFVDSLCYFVIGLIYEGMNIPILLYRSFASSIMLIFLSVIGNKFIKRFFKMDEFYEIPYFEIFIFLMISTFHILLILVISAEYDAIEDDLNEVLVLGFIIGIVLMDLCIIHYLEFMARAYVLEKQILLEQKQSEMKNQHYMDLRKSNEEIRKIIHDFKNHYQVMYSAFQNQEPLLAENIMNKINMEYQKVKTLYHTGNEILDIILEEKHKESNAKKIKFQTKISDIDINFIDNYDVITIFGNILDNAIEATEDLDNIERDIQLTIAHFQEMIIIKLMNTCDYHLEYHDGKLKSSKSGHSGYGIHNVLRAVSKYDGESTIDIDDGLCIVLIYIPMK